MPTTDTNTDTYSPSDQNTTFEREHGPIRSYLDITAPHFHICRGKRPGGYFLQSEAWAVRKMVLKHVTRTVKRSANNSEPIDN
ncbi:MAG: hypothetical protein ABEI86_07335 [Halobacteriaceae archaeon]